MANLEKRPKTGGASSAETRHHGVHIHAPRSVVISICMLVLLAVLLAGAGGFVLGWRARRGSLRGSASVQSAAPNRDAKAAYRAKPGPWGELECIPINIEIPDEYLSTRAHEADLPRWFFVGSSPQAVSNLLESAGLPENLKGELLDASRWEMAPAGIVVRPSVNAVLALPVEARAKIYAVLGRFEQNPAQSQAFSWTEKTAEDFFANADISGYSRTLVKNLCYRRGNLVMFADLPAVLHTLPREDEKRRLEKALSRRPTLLVRLVLGVKSDIPALVKYWSRAGYGKDIEPILRAAAQAPEGTKLSILNMLPPWPTARLYTFPFPTPGAQYDCHWTSFNFFKESPVAPTNDGGFWKRKLDTEYYPVFSDPRYGDIVMLVRPDGMIIHSCVFIADNIVYSKNGASATVPWILTTLPDLLEAYAPEVAPGEKLKVEYYRNKSL